MLKQSIFYLLVLLPLFSCKKDELIHPVQAELLLEIDANENGRAVEPLIVEGGLLRIEGLGFEGYRENGEHYFFNRDFSDTLAVNFSTATAGQVITFEMPQGIYNRININLEVPAAKDSEGISKEVARDLLKGGVEVWGVYMDVHDRAIPFIFLYTAQDNFDFTAVSSAGSQEVVINNEGNRKARLRFNPLEWVQLINPRMLQSAKLTAVDGVPTIIISEAYNDHIYNLLANRIQTSTSLLFE